MNNVGDVSKVSLMPFDKVFNDTVMKKIESVEQNKQKGILLLNIALKKDRYRVEVNKWLRFFEKKGWLKTFEERVYRATTWASFYSKINELRAGYFFEHRFGFHLLQYEVPTENRKNVEFKAIKQNAEFFIEVKTPLELAVDYHVSGWDGRNQEIVDTLLDKAADQLPARGKNIVVLSDDLNLPLFYDGTIKDSIKSFLNSTPVIGAVCILGNVFKEDIYKPEFIISSNADNMIEASEFESSSERGDI